MKGKQAETAKAEGKGSEKAKEKKTEIETKAALPKGATIKDPVEAGSTKKYKTGSWRSFKPKMIMIKCVKCGKCWSNCPEAAIKHNPDGSFEIDYDYCKGCGICAEECPAKAIEMEKEDK